LTKYFTVSMHELFSR